MARATADPDSNSGRRQSFKLPVTGALLGDVPGRARIAAGPFEPSSRPPEDRPALFVPDFFLEDPEPWRLATSWREVVYGADLPDMHGLDAVWDEPDKGPWKTAFRDTLAAIESGDLEKLVPLVFAEGTDKGSDSAARSERFVRRAMLHACDSPPGVTPYALWDSVGGVAGVSPEVLFRTRPDGVVETVALAGTASLEEAGSLLTDRKLRHEHELVIRFISDALLPFGRVELGPTGILRLPHLAHLVAPVELHTTKPPDFEALVKALHPTPALGGLPRKEAMAHLRALDRSRSGSSRSSFSDRVGRGGFGAPFGLRFPDGSGLCVVAIRNICWRGPELRIGAGAGLVTGSILETEWSELRRKIEAVKRVFS